jgi:membrane associated rhomboid family serine protease
VERSFSFGWKLTPAVRYLIGINTVVFLITYLIIPFVTYLDLNLGSILTMIRYWLALTPVKTVYSLALWQLFTYMFLHVDIFHILFNMLAIWMFGGVLEEYWGTRKFLIYYFITGIGAGICYTGFSFLIGTSGVPTIGASGAVYGLLLAFGMLFPDTILLMFLLFPMKAKYAVIIFAGVEFLLSFQITGVAHVAHLGGMLFGFIYLRNQIPLDNFFNFEKRKKKKMEQVFVKREADYENVQKQADKILEKISQSGMDSITFREKEILDKASRLLKEKKENIINIEDYRKYRT